MLQIGVLQFTIEIPHANSLKDKRRVLPCAAYLRGEYGVKGMYVGVPCIIGAKGVEKVIEIKLDRSERARFNGSIKAVRTLLAITRKLRRRTAGPKTARPAAKAAAKARSRKAAVGKARAGKPGARKAAAGKAKRN